MTIAEAKESIGKEFKLSWITSGLAARFDIIRRVDESGVIHGDWLEAPAQDCRLKQEQPEQLKKNKDESEIH